MPKTLVLQSYKLPIQALWLKKCIETVQNWAEKNNYDYLLMGDEIFDFLSTQILNKTNNQKVIAADLARLKAIKKYLTSSYENVVWCDVDFLIFNPEKLILPDESYVLGREVWIQKDSNTPEKLTTHTKVHNAFMMFKQGNNFLEFYNETAENLLLRNTGAMSPQFIGPKLLTAIHNIVQFPILETAGMLSPLVIIDIAANGGKALDLFRQKSPETIAAANLCNSLYNRGEYSATQINHCIEYLLIHQHL